MHIQILNLNVLFLITLPLNHIKCITLLPDNLTLAIFNLKYKITIFTLILYRFKLKIGSLIQGSTTPEQF